MSISNLGLPPGSPFTDQQKPLVESLLASLDGGQAMWLSGFLAARSADPAATAASSQPSATAVPSAKEPLTVLYGTESGNSETCAAEAVKLANAAGFKATMVDMGDYQPSRLAKETNMLVIVSTWGEGDPPERAVDFHHWVMSDKAPKLDQLRYSVCALGDRSYADFCLCGIQFDERFTALGAQRLAERVECDVDFEEPFQKWLKLAVDALADAAGVGTSTSAAAVAVSVEAPAAPAAAPATAATAVEPYGKKRPFPAPIITKINLNGTGSAKETFHVEFSLEGSGMTYLPGDVVGIYPHNCPEVVDDLLQVTGFSGDETVEQKDAGASSLREILTMRHDITSINPALMKKYAAFAANRQLDELLAPEQKAHLTEWIWGREVRDLIREFPPASQMELHAFVGMLRKMPPRLYSIASSMNAHPGEVHLTVGAVRYVAHGHTRKGVCSTFLADRVEEGDTVDLYTHANKHFFLPEDPDTPVIMVGPGTGIAPFRAFMEERDFAGAKGRNWLFFGDQHFNTDFLYQTEWQDYLKRGVLTRMDVAFSRDTDRKVYVQHRMKEKAADLYAWLQDGAWFYVCGDANRMAKDVHAALIEIYAEQGGLDHEAAEAKVKELQKEKRYQRDVY
jgi:sulfite reductase (NADPH) flavoprotein alpha-component